MSVKVPSPSNQGLNVSSCELQDFANGNLVPNLDSIQVNDGGELTRTMNGDRDVANISFDGGFLSITGDFTVKAGYTAPEMGDVVTDSNGLIWNVVSRSVQSLSTGGRPMVLNLTLEFHPALSVAEGGGDGGYFSGTKASASVTLTADELQVGDLIYVSKPNGTSKVQNGLKISAQQVPASVAELATYLVEQWPRNTGVTLSAVGEVLTATANEPGVGANDWRLEGIINTGEAGEQSFDVSLSGGAA